MNMSFFSKTKYMIGVGLKKLARKLHPPSSVFSNNKGTDQPAYPRSLLSTFVIRLLQSISKLATSEISIF